MLPPLANVNLSAARSSAASEVYSHLSKAAEDLYSTVMDLNNRLTPYMVSEPDAKEQTKLVEPCPTLPAYFSDLRAVIWSVEKETNKIQTILARLEL